MTATKEKCTVALLALEFDALVVAYDEADRSKPSGCKKDTRMQVIWQRLEAIREEASYLAPDSDAGAGFQLMLINGYMDGLDDDGSPRQRQIEGQIKRLLYASATYLLGSEQRLDRTREFCMSNQLDPHAILADARGNLR